MGNTSRVSLVVRGMHRSGTSAVAGAAMRLGLAPPRTPLPATRDNPTGFHESFPIVSLNHLVLNAAGCTWHDCLSFDPDMLDAATRAAAFDQCTAVLRQEFANEPAFVVKDPMFCLTLPIWLPALRALGASVSVLLAVRHPEEVAKSLFWRDMLPEAASAAAWLHYMLEAERMTRGLPRAVVHYFDLLQDWPGCMTRAGRTANVAWPNPIGLFRHDTAGVVHWSLRHHIAAAGSVTVGSPPLRGVINEAWTAFWQLGDNPALPSAKEKLDDVRGRFAIHRYASRH